MSNHENTKQDIDDWANMWDEMQEKGIHPEIEKPKPSTAFSSDFFDDNPSDFYYGYLDGQDDLLSEESTVVTQNPVRMDTIGPDNEQPDPAWVKEDFVEEITKMKDKLFKVENELAKMGQGKKHSEKPVNDDGKKLFSQIESLRKDIEKLSSKLGIADEPSPYKVKSK